MKKLLLILTIFQSFTLAHGQNCIANFGYTIDANNVVTVYDSSISSCTLLYFQYDYGDPQSGNLNSYNYPMMSEYKHFYKNAGTYTICQRVFTGTSCATPCSDTLCKQIILPNNGSNCQAVYSYTSNGLSYSFTNSSSADDSITSVYWDFGDGAVSTIYNPYHTYSYPLNYIVCLYIQTSNGCQSSTCDTIMVNPSGINEYVTNNSLTVSPNPFSTETTLHTDKAFKNAALTVYDLYGQQVKQITPITIGAGQTITLQRDNLPSGLYFIRLTQDNKTFSTDKLIITDN